MLFLVSKSKWQLKRKNKETFCVLLFCQFFFGEWDPFFGLMTLFRKVSHETQPENLNLLFVAMNFPFMNDGFQVLAFTLKNVWFCLTINVDSSLFTSGDVFARLMAFPFTVWVTASQS